MYSLYSCAPLVTKTVTRLPAPWINLEAKEMIEEKKAAQTSLKANRYDSVLQQNYSSLKNQAKNLIEKRKKDHYRCELQNSKNIANTWKIVKTLVPSKSSSKISGDSDTTPTATQFNSFFSNVGQTTYETTRASINCASNNDSYNDLHDKFFVPFVCPLIRAPGFLRLFCKTQF